MAKVGRWVTDPKAGAYCTLTFNTGEKIVINHDKGGFKGGWIVIERLKFFGFSSERVFACHLDGEEGKAALTSITGDVEPRSLDATPLGAFVKYVKNSESVAEVKARCGALMMNSRQSRP